MRIFSVAAATAAVMFTLLLLSHAAGHGAAESGTRTSPYAVAATYPVNAEKLRRYAAAADRLEEVEYRDLSVKRWRGSLTRGRWGTSDPAQITAAIDSIPEARQAIESAGITTADWARTYVVLGIAVQVQEVGWEGPYLVPRVHPVTRRLLRDHNADVRAALRSSPHFYAPLHPLLPNGDPPF